jgi:hypothetical protein
MVIYQYTEIYKDSIQLQQLDGAESCPNHDFLMSKHNSSALLNQCIFSCVLMVLG